MEKVIVRFDVTKQAVYTLKKALLLLEKTKQNRVIDTLPEHDELVLATQDSCMQRFKYCTDLLWKYLKDYLELVLKVVPEIRSPKNIIRTSATLGLLTEPEAQHAIDMIESRNMTSHVYRLEIAHALMQEIPRHYELMEIILQKTKP